MFAAKLYVIIVKKLIKPLNNLHQRNFGVSFVNHYTMKFKYIIPVILLVFINANALLAQRKVEQIDPEKQEEQKKAPEPSNKNAWKDKISYGGNIGALFGDAGGLFTLQPMAIYRLTDNTFLGAGVSYYYWQLKITNSLNQSQTISDNAYGFNLFARQQLFDPLFLHTEFMPMNFKVYTPSGRDFKREWVGSFYVGGGVNQRFSDRGGYYVMFLYDLLYNENRSFRASPIDLRTGFYF